MQNRSRRHANTPAMNRRDTCVCGTLLVACCAPVAGVTYACAHFYDQMIASNHVRDRGPEEDRYEWLFSVFFILCVVFITVYVLAWVRFVQYVCSTDDAEYENADPESVGDRGQYDSYYQSRSSSGSAQATEVEIEL